MTILDVSLSWSNTGGSGLKVSGGKITASFTDGYYVTHSYDATDSEIMNALGIGFGDYRTGSTVPCVGISPPKKIGPIYSLVTVEYSAEFSYEVGDTPDSVINKNPLLQPAEIQWDNEIATEPIDEDWNGEPISTTNGEPIHGVTTDIADIVLVVTKNFPAWNPKIIREYLRSTNSDTFATFSPGEVRLKSCPAQRVIDETYGEYWRATARFHMRYPFNTTSAKAWYARVRHEGFLVRTGATINDCEHATRNGEKVVQPVLIKVSDGTEITTGLSDAEWKEIQRFGSLPFNALGFLV